MSAVPTSQNVGLTQFRPARLVWVSMVVGSSRSCRCRSARCPGRCRWTRRRSRTCRRSAVAPLKPRTLLAPRVQVAPSKVKKSPSSSPAPQNVADGQDSAVKPVASTAVEVQVPALSTKAWPVVWNDAPSTLSRATHRVLLPQETRGQTAGRIDGALGPAVPLKVRASWSPTATQKVATGAGQRRELHAGVDDGGRRPDAPVVRRDLAGVGDGRAERGGRAGHRAGDRRGRRSSPRSARSRSSSAGRAR